jgi:toxin ParE1/3/4
VIDWLTEARIEFKHHIAFIHQYDRRAAMRIHADIMRRVTLLNRFPQLGRIGRQPATRELVIIGTPYLVIYAISGDLIQILHVIHGAQQWPPDDE